MDGRIIDQQGKSVFFGWEWKENLFKKGNFLKHSTSVQVVFGGLFLRYEPIDGQNL